MARADKLAGNFSQDALKKWSGQTPGPAGDPFTSGGRHFGEEESRGC